jgi:subtilisin family serine protease
MDKAMNRLTSLFLIIGLCAITFAPAAHGQHGMVAPATPPAPAAKLRKSADAIPDRYIVVFNESVAASKVRGLADALARAHGGTVGFTYRSALRGFSVELNEAQAAALSRNPQVAFVESDVEVNGASTQTNAPWPLDRLDQREPGASNTYTYANDGAGVNVYVIDGGIRYTHTEFGGRAVFAYDYAAGGNGMDCNGHGTHVAGIIGGATYGVAKGVKLHSVRVLNCLNQNPLANVLAGIDWVAANHVKPAVANLSFFTGNANATLDLAVRNLIAAGVTSVVAAGNLNRDASLHSPARVREAITVAATDQNDNRATFSNFGAGVDVFAPGVDIVSASSVDDASTGIRSGTSSAAPHVAGLVARYLASRPGDQPDAVSQAIMNAATPDKVFDPGAGSPNLLAYAGITISDDFNDNARDATKWNAPTAIDITVAERNGRLEITPAAAAAGHEGYKSVTTSDLTDARVSVQASSTQRIDGFGTYFVLSNPTGYLMFGIGGSNLVMQQEVGGVATNTTIPYNATQHRHWRIRHNRADDTVNWEVSANGATWTTLRSVPRPFSITNLQTILVAGKNLSTTPTTTAVFDNLWHEANPTPAVAYADNFDDNLINPAMWTMPDATSPTIVAEQNGRIEVTPQPNAAGYNGVEMAGGFDFRDKTAQVEVQPASQAGAVYTYFKLYLDDNNGLVFAVGANSFTCDSTVNGVLDRTQSTWDATIRYWRFRHNIEANTISFDTSADGALWTTRKTVAVGFPLHALRAGMGGGASGATNVAPGMAVFDNFRIERYNPLFPQSDNFNDNARDPKKWNVNGTSGVSVVEQNGQLQITPSADATGYDGYYSTTNIDLTDAHVAVEVVQPAATSTSGVETVFKLVDPATGYYLLVTDIGLGNFRMETRSSTGTSSSTMSPINSASYRFWRLRHNRAGNSIHLDFSPDGTTWTNPVAMGWGNTPLTNLQIQLYAGKSSATATANTAIFDNLRIERNEGGRAR